MTLGFTVIELIVATAILGLLAALGIDGGAQKLARIQVEAASRRLVVGVERGRDAAQQTDLGCSLSLTPDGWQGVGPSACHRADTPLTERFLPNQLLIASTFKDPLRFTANGLAIDGGTVVIGHRGTDLVRCMVISPPLGVMRLGRYRGVVSTNPESEQCLPDHAL